MWDMAYRYITEIISNRVEPEFYVFGATHLNTASRLTNIKSISKKTEQ
jgi:hypothetical protein